MNNGLGKKIVWIIMVILTVVAGWLVYQNYLKPRYQLADLLPTDYQISLEYKQDHFALPKLQQEKILNNPVLKKIHDILWDRFTQELKKFNDQAQNLLTKTEHLIIFYQDPKTPGLLLDLPPKLTAEAVEKIEFVGWQKKIIGRQVLLLTKNQAWLDNLGQKKIKPVMAPYLSLNIGPWATLRFQKTFLTANYNNELLSQLQTILSPLEFSPINTFAVNLDSDGLHLNLKLKPDLTAIEEIPINLDPYVKYSYKNPDLLIITNRPGDLTSEINNNPRLKNLWQKLDQSLWASYQLSISNLIKELQPPIVLAIKNQNWQLITRENNRDLLIYYLKNHLAQFFVKEEIKKLPDGTLATELKADISQVNLTETINNDWRFWQAPDSPLGLAQKDGIIITSNNLDNLSENRQIFKCLAAETESILKNLNNYLSFRPKNLNFANFNLNLNKISLYSKINGEIQVCLDL